MEPHTIVWSLLLLPLLVAAIILLFFRRQGTIAGFLATISALATVVFTLMLAHPGMFGGLVRGEMEGTPSFSWIDLGDRELQVEIGLETDELALGMMLIVTFVGFLVHLFSLGYMKDDEGKGRYFGGLSLFMFSMTGIVLANNFVMMFIFWELVGVSSYLLISHWYHKPSAADAAKKAFLTNRIGDFGFMLGILVIWKLCGTFHFEALTNVVSSVENVAILNLAVLLIFCGAIGKSAQAPLHVWLPDAMEGPTPVSALIHAATMVAAGVFMMARISSLVVYAEMAATIIAWIGGLTALLAALMALQQSDIKKILAYSTLSQLGYMIMAQGFGPDGSDAGMFHLYTHAFFKALLFLGSGAIIYACHHEQNIWKMGGLFKKMPITSTTFAIGTGALIAIPLSSGFWSKEHILEKALKADHIWQVEILYWIGLFVAFLTPFYMVRLFIVAFLGKNRTKSSEHASEVRPVMLVPLIVLAILSVFSVYWNVPEFLLARGHSESPLDGLRHFNSFNTAVISLLALLLGAGLSTFLYLGKESDPISLPLLRDRFYIDELYGKIVEWGQDRVGKLLDGFDRYVVDPVVAKVPAFLTLSAGEMLRLFQVGNLQTYAFYFGLAVIVLIMFLVL